MNKRYYYKNDLTTFLTQSEDYILGELARNHHFSLDISQKNAWLEQIENLQQQLSENLQGEVFFEYIIPRMGKRVDIVLLIKNSIFVLEYKTGAKSYDKHSVDQSLDYALDLKNFHEGSHNRNIIPILIATKAPPKANSIIWFEDGIAKPLLSNGHNLRAIISEVLKSLNEDNGGASSEWAETGYKPTPTIIEAAQALYQGHNVEAISRSDASALNLSLTSNCITEIIDHSKKNRKKSICFVTGLPGAGKTLAGLNISTRTIDVSSEEHAVFLSGNGPLVTVLREALARDEVARSKRLKKSITKKQALQKVSSFIQNIHHFRDDHLAPDASPFEHVVIFDEAQRAWNREQAEKFMVQKKGQKSFEMSEPEFLISIMDRRRDWATIICLIGGGQEINTGEAGLIEWFNAIQKSFPHWDIYHSDELSNKNYNWGEDLKSKLVDLNAENRKDLHLSVSIRSFRAEKLSDFVSAVVDGDACAANDIYKDLDKYPIFITRDLNKAKAWLRDMGRGTERIGLLASSGGIRLKPEGVHVKNKIDPAHWFLNGKEDIRSSYFLEDTATEFDIQGLELDWSGLCWDADFRMEDGNWSFYNFKGTKWQNVNNNYRRVYLANAYRVLLTRARQGMVIFVPYGNEDDHTRLPKFYDETYQFLLACGICEL